MKVLKEIMKFMRIKLLGNERLGVLLPRIKKNYLKGNEMNSLLFKMEGRI